MCKCARELASGRRHPKKWPAGRSRARRTESSPHRPAAARLHQAMVGRSFACAHACCTWRDTVPLQLRDPTLRTYVLQLQKQAPYQWARQDDGSGGGSGFLLEFGRISRAVMREVISGESTGWRTVAPQRGGKITCRHACDSSLFHPLARPRISFALADRLADEEHAHQPVRWRCLPSIP